MASWCLALPVSLSDRKRIRRSSWKSRGRAIVEITGLDIPLRCVLSRSNQPTPSDVKQDGMVAAALKAGGEIVDIQE